MKTINATEFGQQEVGTIVDDINAGIQLVDASIPIIKEIFGKINEWISQLGDEVALHKVKHIKALEAAGKLQKELNKLYEARLDALEKAVFAHQGTEING